MSLICGTLVYNQIGVLHAEELSRFRFIFMYSKPLRADPHTSFKPDLVWINRDFYLELKDEDGVDITADEYLIQSFHKHGFTDIENLFNSIQGFTLPLPTSNPDDLKDLSGNPHLYSSDFKLALSELRRDLIGLARPKKLSD
eukprot:UN34814